VGLAIAAAITTALALGGVAIVLTRAKQQWRSLLFAFLVALPLQPLVFYLIRLPLDGLLRSAFGAAAWVTLVSLLYAPLTEEPAKWLTAVFPAVRRAIRDNPVAVALAVGLGFGIGEIWFLAHALAPRYPDLPFWMFGGFLLERLAVCFLHGAFVLPAFAMLAHGRSFRLGGLAGIVMHFLLNFPIYLASIKAFGFGDAWPSVLVLWMLVWLALCVGFVGYCSTLRDRNQTVSQSGPTPP
jgi:hypothetical protein